MPPLRPDSQHSRQPDGCDNQTADAARCLPSGNEISQGSHEAAQTARTGEVSRISPALTPSTQNRTFCAASPISLAPQGTAPDSAIRLDVLRFGSGISQ